MYAPRRRGRGESLAGVVGHGRRAECRLGWGGPAACGDDETDKVAEEFERACEVVEEPEPECDGGVARCVDGVACAVIAE